MINNSTITIHKSKSNNIIKIIFEDKPDKFKITIDSYLSIVSLFVYILIHFLMFGTIFLTEASLIYAGFFAIVTGSFFCVLIISISGFSLAYSSPYLPYIVRDVFSRRYRKNVL